MKRFCTLLDSITDRSTVPAIIGDKVGMLKLLSTRIPVRFLVFMRSAKELRSSSTSGQTAMAFNGTIDYFIENTFNYPTLAECYRVAGLNGYNKIAVAG